MEDTDESSEQSTAIDLLIAALYGFGIGVNAYIIIDQLTDGALSRTLSLKLTYLRGKVSAWAARERTYRQQQPHVLFDAITIVESEEK